MTAPNQTNSACITLDFRAFEMTDETFYEFCQRNQDYRFEINAKGEIEIMPPNFLETSRKNNKITRQEG